MDDHWRERAACRGMNGHWFFSRKATGMTEARLARKVCGSCPVQAECLVYELKFEARIDQQRCGVWGGTTPGDRRAIVKLMVAR